MEQPLGLLIVGSDPLARASLAALFDSSPRLRVVGETPGGAGELQDAIGATDPDVLLWDLGEDPEAMSDGVFGSDATEVPVVMLVPPSRRGRGPASAAVAGLLPRDAPPDVLFAALEAAARGLVVYDASLAPRAQARPLEDETPVEDLTPRELEVLQLVADGLANREIGRQLAISENTVKFHVATIMMKLGTHSRTEAVTRAARLGLLVL